MKKEVNRNIKVGLFVTVASILFTLGVYYIGNNQSLFGSTIRISSLFQNVKGLQPGNNVRYSGITVGHVDNIVILNDTTIQVDMLLVENVQNYLKKDAVASIASDGLVGNMIVNIDPGKYEKVNVIEGDVIESYTKMEAGDMMNTLGKTMDNMALLSNNLIELTERLNKGEGSLSLFLNDKGLANDLRLTAQNLRITTQHINSISDDLQSNIQNVEHGQGALGFLLTDSTFALKINEITNDLDSLIEKRTHPILQNLEKSTEDIAVSSAELKDVIQEINLDEGLAYTLFKDSIIVDELQATMSNLNEGSFRFNETMEALQHNFLVKGFFKKKAKKREKEEENNLKKVETAQMNHNIAKSKSE